MTTAAQKRREKKQRQKERGRENCNNVENQVDEASEGESLDGQVEYVPEMLDSMAVGEEFDNVIKKFSFTAEDENNSEEDNQNENAEDNSANMDNEDDEDVRKLSRKQQRKQSRMSLAALKQYCAHPEVVEWEDVTSPDPLLLCQLKSVPHTVPVPRHWSQKRKYLSGKRGYVKPPFQLPSFIRDTGVTEVRDAMRNADSKKRIKVKAREKMHPKLARLSVDYERLYDAFFKFQTKPPLTRHGDLYYEGKEFMGAIISGGGAGSTSRGIGSERKPGILSEELRTALGITSHIIPPPWLHAMQKYGPPPSYPHMRIAGLNSPIPEGAQWGYHPGGWGKPPVDDPSFTRSNGANNNTNNLKFHPIQTTMLKSIENNLWGELLPEEEDEEEEEETEEQGQQNVMALDADDAEIEQYSSDQKLYAAAKSVNSRLSNDQDEIVLVKHSKK